MKLLYRLCWLIIRGFLKFYCRLKVKGVENVPLESGVIIASNHIGAGDPPFIGSCIKRELYFLAKKELFENIFLRILIRNLNAVPVDRSILDKKAIAVTEEALGKGYGLILFPEGTRSPTDTLRRGKPGVGLLARKAMVPIVPAYIENSRGFLKLPFSGKRLKITFGAPISRKQIEEYPDSNEGYRAISEELMSRIGELKALQAGN
jgi:1-acyl-sn-glycerol-3-phosphate acyltransferase